MGLGHLVSAESRAAVRAGGGVSLRAGSRCLPLAVNNLSTGKINDDSWLKICYLIMVPPEKKPTGCF